MGKQYFALIPYRLSVEMGPDQTHEEIMEDSFLLFPAVGFLAQIVDGALGMAYGVVSSSVLLAFGVPPAAA